MGPDMFHVGRTEKFVFWSVVFLVVGLLIGTGFILGRVSADWGHPHIEWRK